MEVGGCLEVGKFSGIESLGLVLLAGDEEALAVHHDETFAADGGIQLLFSQEGGEGVDCFLVLLGGIVAEGEPATGQVSLGVFGMRAEEGLILLNSNRIELPVVGPIGDVILFQGRVVLAILGGRRGRFLFLGGGGGGKSRGGERRRRGGRAGKRSLFGVAEVSEKIPREARVSSSFTASIFDRLHRLWLQG